MNRWTKIDRRLNFDAGKDIPAGKSLNPGGIPGKIFFTFEVILTREKLFPLGNLLIPPVPPGMIIPPGIRRKSVPIYPDP